MADADNLAYLAGELRKHAKKFSDAATTLNTQATQLNWSAEDLADSASSWAGSGSQAFQSAWQNYHTYTTSSTKWLNGTADALNKLAQKIEDKVQQIRDAQAAQTATTWLTVGLVVVDVLQLGLDPVTDAATVGVGAADVGAATAAEAAATAIVEVDAEIGTELDSIATEIEDADSLGDVSNLGDTPSDGLDSGGNGSGDGGGDSGGGDSSTGNQGQPRGGHTNGEDPNRYGNPDRGFGNLDGQEFDVTESDINKIEQHLSRPDFTEPDGSLAPENAKMIERLRTALANGDKISGADASFYFHELYESDLMDNAGVDYATAHRAALDYYNVSDFTVYHPDIIQELQGNFGRLWLKFWGIGGN